jgi:formylglycine-generating enzyme required for sulfatase activity
MMGRSENEPGSSDLEDPQHQVTLTKGFYMGKYQVTQAQYEAVVGSNPSYFHGGSGREPTAGETQENRPVEMVSFYDVLVFCNKLSMNEGLEPAYRINGSTDPAAWETVPKTLPTIYDDPAVTWDAVQIVPNSTGYRLPTEAQWEYACRAGTTTAYNTGTAISDDTGWYRDNSGGRTHEVGLKPANAWGLYDMHGNVFEWCQDFYGQGYYYDESYAPGGWQTDPTGIFSGTIRVLRGGDFSNGGQWSRSAYRCAGYPSGFDEHSGFRVVRPSE